MNVILQSLDIEVPPAQEANLIKRILADNLVTLRCQEAMINSLVVCVVQGLHPIEKAALVKRLGVPPKKIGALWVFYDSTEATTNPTPYSFGLKATCKNCHQDRFYEPPRPHWEPKEIMNGTRKTFTDIWVEVSKEDCDRVLERVVWRHCGITDNPPEDLLLGFDQRMRELVPRKTEE